MGQLGDEKRRADMLSKYSAPSLLGATLGRALHSAGLVQLDSLQVPPTQCKQPGSATADSRWNSSATVVEQQCSTTAVERWCYSGGAAAVREQRGNSSSATAGLTVGSLSVCGRQWQWPGLQPYRLSSTAASSLCKLCEASNCKCSYLTDCS